MSVFSCSEIVHTLVFINFSTVHPALASNIANVILLLNNEGCYISSQTLKVPYSAVITSEPFDVLTQLLGNRQVQDRYSLSWKFIDTFNLEPKEVHVIVAPPPPRSLCFLILGSIMIRPVLLM